MGLSYTNYTNFIRSISFINKSIVSLSYIVYIYIYIYIYTELGTILKKILIDTITITHFFLIIDTTTITFKKIIVDKITNTEFS